MADDSRTRLTSLVAGITVATWQAIEKNATATRLADSVNQLTSTKADLADKIRRLEEVDAERPRHWRTGNRSCSAASTQLSQGTTGWSRS